MTNADEPLSDLAGIETCSTGWENGCSGARRATHANEAGGLPHGSVLDKPHANNKLGG